jgi:hypothetical protein
MLQLLGSWLMSDPAGYITVLLCITFVFDFMWEGLRNPSKNLDRNA